MSLPCPDGRGDRPCERCSRLAPMEDIRLRAVSCAEESVEVFQLFYAVAAGLKLG